MHCFQREANGTALIAASWEMASLLGQKFGLLTSFQPPNPHSAEGAAQASSDARVPLLRGTTCRDLNRANCTHPDCH